MKQIDCGISGTGLNQEFTWRDLSLAPCWLEIINSMASGSRPRPVQLIALRQGMLESRRNLIVSAPTNGGKSLLGHLALLDAVRLGRRAVLLEPLRVLARERLEQLEQVSKQICKILGRPVDLRITTGDYRMDNDSLLAPPPENGQLVIATPERLDVILRNPAHDAWIASIGAICVDEAHLIGSPRRGATLECLLTSFLCLPSPPRIVLLSATLGSLDRLVEWLKPCDVACTTDRYPALRKMVVKLDQRDEPDEIVSSLVSECLKENDASALVFVYQTRSAERLSEMLQGALGVLAGPRGVCAYHARMTATQRESVRADALTGRTRCIVATTALGMGVNLPATHVFVRDCTFPPHGPLSVGDLLQMMGRAGRGDQTGIGHVLVRPGDAWNAENLADCLRTERLPVISSFFDSAVDSSPLRPATNMVPSTAAAIANRIVRFGDDGWTSADMTAFFGRSLGGRTISKLVPQAIAWLCSPERSLAYKKPASGVVGAKSDNVALTSLGRRAVRSALPLSLAAGVGQLVRDLLQIDSEDSWLRSWSFVDHLLVLELLADHRPHLRAFSEHLAELLDGWFEDPRNPKSILFSRWVFGAEGHSRAEQLLGSLNINLPSIATNNETGRRMAYLATLRAVVLFRRSRGETIDALEGHLGISGLNSLEERWRDERLWLLAGMGRVLDVNCFKYHLLTNCDAGEPRVQRIAALLRSLRLQTFDLREDLRYCSPLGSTLRAIRRQRRTAHGQCIGLLTIRRLEAAGIDSIHAIQKASDQKLAAVGIRQQFIRQLREYVRLRSA